MPKADDLDGRQQHNDTFISISISIAKLKWRTQRQCNKTQKTANYTIIIIILIITTIIIVVNLHKVQRHKRGRAMQVFSSLSISIPSATPEVISLNHFWSQYIKILKNFWGKYLKIMNHFWGQYLNNFSHSWGTYLWPISEVNILKCWPISEVITWKFWLLSEVNILKLWATLKVFNILKFWPIPEVISWHVDPFLRSIS